MKTRFGLSLIRVRGESMRPRLEPGDFVVFRHAGTYAPGDTVLVDHPIYGLIVKSVIACKVEQVWLEGIAPQSTSAAALGSVAKESVIGRQIWRIAARSSSPVA